MANKYKFDPNSLDYQEDTLFSKILKALLTQFVTIIFVGVFIFLVLSYITETPIEKNYKNQNKLLKQEYKRLYSLYLENEKNLKVLEQQDYDLYQVFFGIKPEDNNSYNTIIELQDEKPKVILKKNIEKIEKLQYSLDSTKIAFEELMNTLKTNSKDYNFIPAIQPVPNSKLQLLIYGFGERLDPIYLTSDIHTGLDYGVPIGTPVFATADGTVSVSGYYDRETGTIVRLNHGDFQTSYHHLENTIVKVGKKVKRGDIIGYVGTSGKSLIPHLHYEIKYKGKPLNPIFFFFLELTPNEFKEIYLQSVRAGISLD
jgi:murein DD-endopeptidase MepM/ murein hydrolase activator NlpD